PRSRMGEAAAPAGAGQPHRRPVRRQVLRARRAGDPPPTPCRQLPHRDRRLLLGRPPGEGHDYEGGDLPRAAGVPPREVPAQGGSPVTLAKGNRSKVVTEACKKHGGFYLGSVGGPAAILAQTSIRKVELVDFEDLGMEAIRKIDVVNFPAFLVVDDKGNDFFE